VRQDSLPDFLGRTHSGIKPSASGTRYNGIRVKFWEREVSNGHDSSGGTHVKDLKNLFDARSLGGDRLSVPPRVQMSRDRIPFTLLGGLPQAEYLLRSCDRKYNGRLETRVARSTHTGK